MEEKQFIDEISNFIWDKVRCYYKQRGDNGLYNKEQINTNYEQTLEIEKWKSQNEAYNNEIGIYKASIRQLESDLKTASNQYLSEQHKNRLLEDEKDALLSMKESLRKELETIREEHKHEIGIINNKHKEEISFLKEKLEEAVNDKKDIVCEKNKLLDLFNKRVDEQVEHGIVVYKRENEELKKKNEYYKNLYEDKSKGKFYETELHPRLLEYNTKYIGGQWKIEHVGSKSGGKCDFIFKHKDTGVVILLDTKNNIQSQPVNNVDIEKFLKDVSLESNNATGGILLANSRISSKREFEINEHRGKTLMFISDFNQENVGFIFCMLDYINEKHKEGEKSANCTKVKEGMVEDIRFIKERINLVTLEKRKLEIHMLLMENRFMTLHGMSIEEWENAGVVLPQLHNNIVGNVDKFETTHIDYDDDTDTNTDNSIIDFERIEKDRIVIGKRTKYYLQYEDKKKNAKILQYFQDNSRKRNKMKKLGMAIETIDTN